MEKWLKEALNLKESEIEGWGDTIDELISSLQSVRRQVGKNLKVKTSTIHDTQFGVGFVLKQGEYEDVIVFTQPR